LDVDRGLFVGVSGFVIDGAAVNVRATDLAVRWTDPGGLIGIGASDQSRFALTRGYFEGPGCNGVVADSGAQVAFQDVSLDGLGAAVGGCHGAYVLSQASFSARRVSFTGIQSTGIQTALDGTIDLEDVLIDGAGQAGIALRAAPAAAGEGMLLARLSRVVLSRSVGTALCIDGTGSVDASDVSISGTRGEWDFCFDMEHHHAVAQGVVVESRSHLTLSRFDIEGVGSSSVAEGITTFSSSVQLNDGNIRTNAIGLHVYGPFKPQDHMTGIALDNMINYEDTLSGN
jgi:hypothetical protein